MGTTSQKLQYLTTTKGKIKDAINLTGANILSEDTFRSYADKLKQGLVDAINDGGSTIYSNFPKTTGEGTEIALNDTYEAPMEIGLNGNTHQDSYTGKNLLDTIVFKDRTINCYTINSDKTITQTATDTNLWQNSYMPHSIILNSGTYTISVNNRNDSKLQIYNLTTNSNIVERKVDSYTFTLNNDNQVINVKLYGASSYPFTFTMQIEQGETASSFEPFVGGSPSPSPDFPQPVKVVTGDNTINIRGKNLAKSFVNGDSLYRYSHSLYVEADFEVGKKYAISFVDKSVGNSYYRNEYLMQNIPSYSITATGERQTYYFECKSNDKTDSNLYVEGKGFDIFKNNAVLEQLPQFEDIQIEEVTSYDIPSTPYEPYQSKDYEISLKSKNLFDKNTMTMTNTFVNPEIGSSNGFTSIYTPCTPNTTYTISKAQETSRFYVGTTETLPTVGMTATVVSSSATGTTKTFTTGANANYIVAMVRSNNDTLTEEQIVAGIQIEENSTATEYEEFYDYKLCKINDYKDKIDKSTGKNLFNKNTITSIINGSLSNDVIVSNAISTDYGGVSANINNLSLNAGTYYISMKVKRASGTNTYNINRITLVGIDSSQITMVEKPTLSGEYQIYMCRIIPSSSTNITNIGVQLQASNNSVVLNIKDIMISTSNDTTYEPYGEQWYIKKEISKVVVDTSNITLRSNYTNIEYAEIPKPNDFIGKGNYDDYNVYCSHAISDIKNAVQYAWDSTYRIGKITNKANVNNLWLGFSKGTGLDNIKTALNGAIIYYVLATPTYEIITNETLINQLEELEKAKSVDDKTFISQINEQLPFILDVSALSKN